MMNRATFVEKLTEVQHAVEQEQVLVPLQATEVDKFVAHLLPGSKQYRLVCEHPNKGNKATDARLSQATKWRSAWASREISAHGSEINGTP